MQRCVARASGYRTAADVRAGAGWHSISPFHAIFRPARKHWHRHMGRGFRDSRAPGIFAGQFCAGYYLAQQISPAVKPGIDYLAGCRFAPGAWGRAPGLGLRARLRYHFRLGIPGTGAVQGWPGWPPGAWAAFSSRRAWGPARRCSFRGCCPPGRH